MLNGYEGCIQLIWIFYEEIYLYIKTNYLNEGFLQNNKSDIYNLIFPIGSLTCP